MFLALKEIGKKFERLMSVQPAVFPKDLRQLTQAEILADESWKPAYCYYSPTWRVNVAAVADVRPELEAFAREASSPENRIVVRYNGEKKRAELVDQEGILLAAAWAHHVDCGPLGKVFLRTRQSRFGVGLQRALLQKHPHIPVELKRL
jgi:hypothetical protein